MDTRATIERLLDEIYTARQRQDLDAIVACFHQDAVFKINGPGAAAVDRAQHRSAIGGLFDAFALSDFQISCRVIDPPCAVVHWRGSFRAKTGKVANTDILDLIEVRDGRVSSLTTFFDTALAASLVG